ncbi:DUF881 domain-containing protein [Raineyella sp. LH-20]|uniref:DUF881 domain-containing protein n=1 Tax=Raineyella sp. LH-20 TaxID=3081204 RepID=UPI002954F7B2|nr:DUF881 domain-containing protein [Raineyella sp. LH-20]WOP18117.1 DUF881 domain-containing protein [Raineyella sp. LH-20]
MRDEEIERPERDEGAEGPADAELGQDRPQDDRVAPSTDESDAPVEDLDASVEDPDGPAAETSESDQDTAAPGEDTPAPGDESDEPDEAPAGDDLPENDEPTATGMTPEPSESAEGGDLGPTGEEPGAAAEEAPDAGLAPQDSVEAPQDSVEAPQGSVEAPQDSLDAEVAAYDTSVDAAAGDAASATVTAAPPASETPDEASPSPVRPTFRDWLRPERTQVVVAILLAVVAFAVVTQIRSRGQVDSYSSLRQSDLVGMLDGLNQESRRLQNELESLQAARDQLQSGQDNETLARAQAEDRLTALGILAGTIPAQGQGITITITDPQAKVKPAMILDALEEMRDAGGEVMQINGRIRVVASTWVGSGASGIVVDGQAVSTPITLEVIGDPHSLEEAARFRGGLVSQITDPRVGGQVTITKSDNLTITSLHTARSPQFARTDPNADTGTGKGN